MHPHIERIIQSAHTRRMTNWVGLAPDLCGSPVTPLSLRHVLEFIIADNAFFAARRAVLGDIFDFLWRLHPRYARPERSHLLRSISRCPPFHRLVVRHAFPRSSAAAFVDLQNWVRNLNLFSAEAEIRSFIAAAYADHPGYDATDSEKPLLHGT